MSDLRTADLWSWVEWRASESPSAPLALDEYDRVLDFEALRAEGEAVAAGLLEWGVRPGSRVAWVGPTRIESLLLTVALARLSCEQVPLLPSYGPRERRMILEQSRPDTLIEAPRSKSSPSGHAEAGEVEADEGEGLQALASPVDGVRRVAHFEEGLPRAHPASLLPYSKADGDPTRWIFYTSGTTSSPKGALHSDGTLRGAAIGLKRPHVFTPEDRVSLVFPFPHIGGPTLLISALRVGHALILVERFEPELVIRTLSQKGVTLAGSGPAFWQAYLAAQRATPDRPLFPKLRALIGGGAAKPAHLNAAAREVFGVEIISGYGSTECPGLAYNHMDDPPEVLATDGRAVEGVEIRVVDADGASVKPGREGEVRVRGPMLFRGYLDPLDNVGAFDSEGWLRTGDVGRLDAVGQLRITGREKDVIIRKGENISAKEIEDVLGEHASIEDVCVIGLPDRERGERSCAVIVPADAAHPLTLADVTTLCADAGLMKQKFPEQVEIVDALPRNETGKILKAALRTQFADE